MEETFPLWEDPPTQKDGARAAERWFASPGKSQPYKLLCRMGANHAKPASGAACPGTEECVSGHLTQKGDGPKPR